MPGVWRIVIMVAALAWAAPALAQTPASGADERRWYIGASAGTSVVEKAGGVVGAEGGMRVWRNLDVVGEIVWAQNVVTRRQLDTAEQLAAHLAQTQGGSATGSVDVPALYSGLGVRWVFEDARFKPYLVLTLGGARTELQPELVLNGADITGAAADYGITLGQDVIGESNDFATEFGIGILHAYGPWYAELGARLLSIAGDRQRVNVARLVIGGGYSF